MIYKYLLFKLLQDLCVDIPSQVQIASILFSLQKLICQSKELH